MYKFVVIDDEPLIRKGILKKIESLDLEIEFVGEADNGEDALELIGKLNPHIILTDMRMPVMDGKSLLKVLQKEYPDKKVIVISGFTDFEYMQEAIAANVIGYLLKPFNRDEISKALEKAIGLIKKNNSLQEKIQRITTEKEQIDYHSDVKLLSDLVFFENIYNNIQKVKSKRLDFVNTSELFVLTTVYSKEFFEHQSDLKPKLELMLPDNCIILSNPSIKMSFCILICLGKLSHDSLKIKLTEVTSITSFCFTENDIKFHLVGISNSRKNILELNICYKECIQALDQYTINQNSNVLVYNNALPDLNILLWDKCDELLFFVETGNSGKVSEYIDEFFDFFESKPLISMSTIKCNCQHIFDNIRTLFTLNYDFSFNTSFSSRYELIMNSCFDIDSIKAYFSQLLMNISKLFKEKNLYQSDEIIENIKNYITNNYSKNLTLEKLSSLFFINPSYCSYLFKEKTGVNFSDYLINIRIDHAKEYLKNTDYKTDKISKLIGYDNEKYFFRIFKKISGYTPTEYRNKGIKT